MSEQRRLSVDLMHTYARELFKDLKIIIFKSKAQQHTPQLPGIAYNTANHRLKCL